MDARGCQYLTRPFHGCMSHACGIDSVSDWCIKQRCGASPSPTDSVGKGVRYTSIRFCMGTVCLRGGGGGGALCVAVVVSAVRSK